MKDVLEFFLGIVVGLIILIAIHYTAKWWVNR